MHVCVAHTKILFILCQTTPILAQLRLLSQRNQEFFDEKVNCKSNEIHLAAIEQHFTSGLENA
jgi:hypothetical protein